MTAAPTLQVTQTLQVTGAVKRFGAVLALSGIDPYVNAGEVLALLGDTRAGKSTLIKCICGVHRLEAGQIAINGQPLSLTTPAEARESRRSIRTWPCSTIWTPRPTFMRAGKLRA